MISLQDCYFLGVVGSVEDMGAGVVTLAIAASLGLTVTEIITGAGHSLY